jgi:hypothetical protein
MMKIFHIFLSFSRGINLNGLFMWKKRGLFKCRKGKREERLKMLFPLKIISNYRNRRTWQQYYRLHDIRLLLGSE